ncbi:MAG: ArsR/SmtB family transcription factor [Acidimicrobiales bacterium]
MTTAFDVLAEPTRRQVLSVLLSGPRPVGQLSTLLGQSQPGMSRHLRILRDAGLVGVRQVAQQRWYELRPGPLAEIDAWLAPFRKEWSDRLARLEEHLGQGEEAHIA